METAVLVAPVTALEFFLEDYLLKGGPSTTEPSLYDLVAFGGKGVRLVRLVTEHHGGDHLRLEAPGHLIELRDWILDVCWLYQDGRSLLGVALAHNSVLLLDPHEGKPFARCSCLDGCLLYSALLLVDKSWTYSVLVGGTVFNQLVLWRPDGRGEVEEEEGRDPERKAPVERRLLGHSGVIFSIHYLREKGWLASASDDRSVRVWMVGDLGGPRQTCGDPDPTCLLVLYGHQARVFSVCLSPGNVYSAGEDGCCLVWSPSSGGKVVQTLKGHRAGGIRALAVSAGRDEDGTTRARCVATGGADGGVRLWWVGDDNDNKDDGDDEGEEEVCGKAATKALTDLKFLGRGTPKVVCVVEDGAANWARSKILVCTDQGAVYQGCGADGQWDFLWQGDLAYQAYCVMGILMVSVKNTLCKAHLCAVGNLGGGIHVFAISHPQRGLSLRGEGKIHSLIWTEGDAAHAGYLLASGANGLVHRWHIEAQVDRDSGLVALIAEPCPPFVLPPCAKRWLTTAVHLPKGPPGALWVCGDRRGSLLLFQERSGRAQREVDEERVEVSLLMSSVDARTNKDAEKETKCCDERWGDTPIQPRSCLFGVHGKQGVTSVCEHRDLFYSAGRDGCVRIFRISPAATPRSTQGKQRSSDGEEEEEEDAGGGPQLEVLRVQRACKGMEWLERVLILTPPEDTTTTTVECTNEKDDKEVEVDVEKEGMDFASRLRKLRIRSRRRRRRVEMGNRDGTTEESAALSSPGSTRVHFVGVGPCEAGEVAGGALRRRPRSWSLWPPCASMWPGYGALVFIKHGAVVASQPPKEASISAGVPSGAGA
ncbi:hypothetical protein CRUP_002466 [Coryphaenoides rupestris]|nr:hypothetical protein CRUP_002466 [Coryphaenoides rupestris]